MKKICVDYIIKNAKYILTMDNDLNILENYSIVIRENIILDIGKSNEINNKYEGKNVYDASNFVVTPGLIDCHTHLVFSKSREDEYLSRINGINYLDILKKGGGILNSAKHMATAEFDELVNMSVKWLNIMRSFGITCVEIKSGYGMDYYTELKMLNVINALKDYTDQLIIPTFLAHVVPNEYKKNRNEYINLVKNKMLPDFKKLASHFDIFIEKNAFNYEEADTLLETAKNIGYKIKIHTNQINKLGGCLLAKKYNAISVDHLDNIDEDEMKILSKINTIAVLLPGASYFLNSENIPPISLFKKYNIPIAISTDFNPGSCPSPNIHFMMSLAVHRFKMGIYDVWKSVTINAAKALDISNSFGSICIGKKSNFVIWDMNNFIFPFYNFGLNFVKSVII